MGGIVVKKQISIPLLVYVVLYAVLFTATFYLEPPHSDIPKLVEQFEHDVTVTRIMLIIAVIGIILFERKTGPKKKLHRKQKNWSKNY